jgi:putative acetyltransferase
MNVTEESQYLPESIALLDASIAFTRSLYKEEEHYSYNLSKIENFFLLRKDGTTLGCGSYSWIEKYIELKHIYVSPNSRGMGAGRFLVNHIINHGVNAGAIKILLETTLKQQEAIGLYKSLGFVDIEPYFEPYHNEIVFMGKFV